HMLVIFDEASGIPDEIWDAAEAVAVGENNKILAIGNPLITGSRFYRKFRDDFGWAKITISALVHPNITKQGNAIPGCVTTWSIQQKLAEWCDPLLTRGGGFRNPKPVFQCRGPGDEGVPTREGGFRNSN